MSAVFENIKLSRRNQHILFWLVWVISFTYIKSIGFEMLVYLDWLFYYLITLPVFIIHTYIIAYWLVPRFFLKKRYILSIIIFIGLLYIFSVVELLLANEIIFKHLSFRVIPEANYLELKNIIISGIGNHYIIILFLSVKVLKSWYKTENKKNELQLQTIESEIQLLKNQLQPKFLLNVMDVLESMAVEKSENTPEMIIRISNLMNNILLDNTNEKISLRKELNLIESYIDIRKMVQTPNIKTQVVRSGDLDSRKIPILFFFPVVEKIMKLFKYSDVGNDFKIFAKSEEHYLLFLVSFYHYRIDPYSKLETEIEKLKKRLEYYYTDYFSLNYSYSNGFAELTIEILKQ